MTEHQTPTTLSVFPFLAPDAATSGAACVNALKYLSGQDSGAKAEWYVQVNCAFVTPLTRAESDQLTAAIARCWAWIGEQEVK